MMKGIILAAGEGQRLRPLTANMPKVMIPIGNKPILQYVIETMAKAGIRRISIVVGYHSEKIRQYFGNGRNFGVEIDYVIQNKQLGTAHALYMARTDEDIIVVPGDNIISKDCLEGLKEGEKNRIVGIFSRNASKYGVIRYEKGFVKEIVEKPSENEENLIFTGIGVFGPEIFDEISNHLEEGIYELPDVINRMEGVGLHIADCLWKDAIYPWDLLELNSWALKEIARSLAGRIGRAEITGNVEIGDGTVISSGVYIKGPVKIGKNCYIGPNTVILPDTSIGNDVSIGALSFVKNSIIMNSTVIGHGSSIENSVVGRGCSIGAKFSALSCNFRKIIGDDVIEIRDGGAIIGDDCRIGEMVSAEAGSRLDAESKVPSYMPIREEEVL
jgi:UDP-N-acetylglucosamine diphosphorylase/glucosamine-1-phosphate N-acetyltransferase